MDTHVPPQPAPLQVDIVSDTICPWCYVGKRHLEAALPLLAQEGIHVERHWRPFQLNPTMPPEGVDRRTYRMAKFGSWARSQALDAQVAAAGAAAGLTFRHDLMARTPNTVASHTLVRLAIDAGGPDLQDRVIEALFAAYFTQGQDVGDHDTLVDLATRAGLPHTDVVAALADPRAAAAVIADERLARTLDLDGVPTLIHAGRVLFSGAQPVETMVRVLRAVHAIGV